MTNNNNNNNGQQGQQQQQQAAFDWNQATPIEKAAFVGGTAQSVWDWLPAGNHAITVAGKSLGFTKPSNYTGKTSSQDIKACVQEYMGAEQAEVVENNMSVSSNFVPRKGALGHFFATIGTGIVAGTAAFFGGKAMASKGQNQESAPGADNVVDLGNQGYDHLNFG